MFCQRLYETDWAEVEISRNKNVCQKLFFKIFMFLYDEYFPIKRVKLLSKDINSNWMTIGIKKSSKHKQHMYGKILEN